MNKMIIVTVFVAILLLSGCYVVSKPQLLSIEDIRINDFSADSISMDISTQLYNPNILGTSLIDMNYSIFIDTLLAGYGIWEGPLTISRKSSFHLDIPLVIPLITLNAWQDAFGEEDSLCLRLSGNAKLANLRVKWNLPFNLEMNFRFQEFIKEWMNETLKQVEPRVEKVRLSKMELSHSLVIVELSVFNPLPFPVVIDSLVGEVAINESRFGTVNLQESVLISPEETKYIRNEVEIPTVSLGLGVFSGIMGGGWRYTFNGKLMLSYDGFKITIPVTHSGDLTKL